MAKKRPKAQRPKRTEHPLVKQAYLLDKYEIEFSRLQRCFKRLDKLRKSIQNAGKAAQKKAQEERHAEGTP